MNPLFTRSQVYSSAPRHVSPCFAALPRIGLYKLADRFARAKRISAAIVCAHCRTRSLPRVYNTWRSVNSKGLASGRDKLEVALVGSLVSCRCSSVAQDARASDIQRGIVAQLIQQRISLPHPNDAYSLAFLRQSNAGRNSRCCKIGFSSEVPCSVHTLPIFTLGDETVETKGRRVHRLIKPFNLAVAEG